MRFLYEYPALSKLSCESCQKWMTRIPDGLIETVNDAIHPLDIDTVDESQLMPRPAISDPPCHKCPRGGPENEEGLHLTPENIQLINLCRRLDSPGYELPEHLQGDSVFADNYATFREVVEDVRAKRRNRELAYELATLIVRR